jgi:cytochrome P450
MSQCDIHYHASIFPEPRHFEPERWLRGAESKKLEKWLAPFSRGAWGCMGIK